MSVRALRGGTAKDFMPRACVAPPNIAQCADRGGAGSAPIPASAPARRKAAAREKAAGKPQITRAVRVLVLEHHGTMVLHDVRVTQTHALEYCRTRPGTCMHSTRAL